MTLELDRRLSRLTRRFGTWRWAHRVYGPLRSHYLKKYHKTGIDPLAVIDDYDRDLKLEIDRSAHIGSTIYWRGFYSLKIIEFLARNLSEEMVFMDVGANQGEITLFAAKRLSRGRVYAFEPLDEMRSRLCRNLELNAFTNVEVLDYGLSDRGGRLPIYTRPGEGRDGSRFNEGMASLFRSETRARKLGEVHLHRMDDVFDSLGTKRLDLIKIDTEGAEPLVLEGAREVLKGHRPLLIVEANREALESAGSSPEGMTAILADLGYRPEVLLRKGRTRSLGTGPVPDLCDLVGFPEGRS